MHNVIGRNASIAIQCIVSEDDGVTGCFVAPAHAILAFPIVICRGNLVASIEGATGWISLADPGKCAQFIIATGQACGVAKPNVRRNKVEGEVKATTLQVLLSDRAPGFAELGIGGGQRQSQRVASGVLAYFATIGQFQPASSKSWPPATGS